MVGEPRGENHSPMSAHVLFKDSARVLFYYVSQNAMPNLMTSFSYCHVFPPNRHGDGCGIVTSSYKWRHQTRRHSCCVLCRYVFFPHTKVVSSNILLNLSLFLRRSLSPFCRSMLLKPHQNLVCKWNSTFPRVSKFFFYHSWKILFWKEKCRFRTFNQRKNQR